MATEVKSRRKICSNSLRRGCFSIAAGNERRKFVADENICQSCSFVTFEWKDADPDIPIPTLKQAKTECAKLQ